MTNLNKIKIIILCIAVCAAAIFVLRPASPPQDPAFDRERNFKVRVEADGRRMATARWAIVPEDVRIVRYPWIYDGSLVGYTFAMFGKDYEDPSVYGPGIGTIDLEALLPNFEAKTGKDDPRFKDSYLGDVIKMEISAEGPLARNIFYKGLPIIESSFKIHFSSVASEKIQNLHQLDYKIKPDRFGFKRFGPVGDFEQFRDWGSASEIYYPEQSPKERFMVCSAEEIKDRDEDATWNGRRFCTHWYYSPFLNGQVKLFYHRIYLKDWKKLEQDAEAFFKRTLDIKQLKGEN